MTATTELPKDDQSVSADTENARSPLSRKERRLSVLASCCAFFVSYVLTAGPVVFIVKRFDLPVIGAIVQALYAPLVLIIKLNVPILAPLIKAYVGLFR